MRRAAAETNNKATTTPFILLDQPETDNIIKQHQTKCFTSSICGGYHVRKKVKNYIY